MAITYGSIAGAEPSTVTFNVETVIIDHNSTQVHREILVIGDPQTSNALARVVAAPPGSTEFGQIVRIASGPSSGADLLMRPVFSSTAADNPVSAVQGTSPWVVGGNSSVRANLSSTAADNPVRALLSSTAADNPVLVSGNSTVVIAAIAAGLLSTAAAAGNSSALNVRVVGGASSAADFLVRPVFSSTAADNPVTVSGTVAVTGYSTIVTVANQVRVSNSTATDLLVRPVFSSTSTDNPVSAVQSGTWTVQLGAGLISSAAGSSGSSALLTRPIIDDILTTASTNAFSASTAFAVASSLAARFIKVVAYSITSTVQTAQKMAFYSGSTMIWPVSLQAVSSGMSGVNLAVSGPACIFKTKAVGRPLTLNVPSSLAGFRVGVSYYTGP